MKKFTLCFGWDINIVNNLKTNAAFSCSVDHLSSGLKMMLSFAIAFVISYGSFTAVHLRHLSYVFWHLILNVH